MKSDDAKSDIKKRIGDAKSDVKTMNAAVMSIGWNKRSDNETRKWRNAATRK
jgi:hypothetical protein